MDEADRFDTVGELTELPQMALLFQQDDAQADKISRHRAWLNMIRRERPRPEVHYRVGIYIRYFNQTKYSDYLDYHKKQYLDTLNRCLNWELVGFYVDEGQTAPNMESAPEWSRLVQDCFDGKVDLIITQKVSNVTKKMNEVTILSRLLAAQKPPIGIYFVSEDIFTLSSYYLEDLRDTFFLPGPEVAQIPEDDEVRMLSDD